MLTEQLMTQQLRDMGLQEGDTVLVHSSFKSLGEVEGGAATVIKSFQNAIGESGTLVFPTLCQKDWLHVYENWHMDAPSDVGYLTNFFRKLPGALRSNNATHSVAAIGKYAEYITKTHGDSGLIPGPYGDGCFAKDSPWEKLYELDAKVFLIGVLPGCVTLRHLAEHRVLAKYLDMIEGTDSYEPLKEELWLYKYWERRGIHTQLSPAVVRERTDVLSKKGTVGEATCRLISAREFVDMVQKAAESFDPEWRNTPQEAADFVDWTKRVEAAAAAYKK